MSKKSKIPLALRFIQWAFPKLEALSPRLASRWFQHLFFTPIRYKLPEKEMQVLKHAEKYELKVGEKAIRVNAWGKGPVIVVVHGWAGRGTQFRKFIAPFNQAGFRVVALDGPAHGQSQGKSTEIMEFAQAITSVFMHEKAVAIIAHSFGGVASLYAIAQGMPATVLVNIASPTIAEEIVQNFLKALKASARMGQFFREFIIKRTGKQFEDFSALALIKQVKTTLNLLLIYDENDQEVTMAHAHAMKKQYPQAILFETKGLGHTRILKEETVINRCVTFIQQRASSV